MTFLLGYARINKVFSREFIVIFISNTKILIHVPNILSKRYFLWIFGQNG